MTSTINAFAIFVAELTPDTAPFVMHKLKGKFGAVATEIGDNFLRIECPTLQSATNTESYLQRRRDSQHPAIKDFRLIGGMHPL